MLCLIVKEGKKEMFLYPFLFFQAQDAKTNRGFSIGHVHCWYAPYLIWNLRNNLRMSSGRLK